MRPLVLGGSGMLGHKVFQRLRRSIPGTACSIRRGKAESSDREVPLLRGDDVFRGVSALDFASVTQVLERHKSDVVINCLGIIKQKLEPRTQADLWVVNSEFPHQVSQWCASRGIRFIQLSTDCVFSGARGSYTEDDQADSQEPYGISKFKGEVSGPHALTIRTSFVGRELASRSSLLEWFLGQAGTSVSGYTRAWFSGVTTGFLAEVLEQILRKHPTLSGLFHLAGGRISKHDLLLLFRDVFDLSVDVVPDSSMVCDRSLLGDRLFQAIRLDVPDWATLLRQLRDDPTPYDYWRILR
jgi:dTDP-4-dehydrorhamnose reductase